MFLSLQVRWVAMSKRNQRRVKAIVPLKITVNADGQNYLGHSVDISDSGASMILPVSLDPGTEISLEYKRKRCRAIAVWCKPVGKYEHQIGLRLLNREQSFWLVNLATQEQEEDDFSVRTELHWDRLWSGSKNST